MANKQLTTYIIIGLIIVGAIFMFQKGDLFKAKPTVPAGTSQGGLSLSGCVVGADNECITNQEQLQTTVTIIGKQPTIGARFVRIFSSLTAIGTVPKININGFTGSPTEYDTEIQNQMKQTFELLKNEINNQNVTLDFTKDTIPYGQTTFSMLVDASFKDARGNDIPITPQPSASINILKEKDTCDDGTPWGECNPNNKPKYCEPGTLNDPIAGTTYQQGQLIDKASICGCADGLIINPNDPTGDTCTEPSCLDGTIVGECVQPTPTEPLANDRYCTAVNGELIEKCSLCGCSVDYWEFPSIGCDANDLCLYEDYTGDVSIVIGTGSPGYVQFRTSDLNYGLNSEIAFSNLCGEQLIGYGNPGGILDRTFIGSCNTAIPGPILIAPIPCTITDASVCYLGESSSTGNKYICWETINGEVYERIYSQTSTIIDKSINTINEDLEVTC